MSICHLCKRPKKYQRSFFLVMTKVKSVLPNLKETVEAQLTSKVILKFHVRNLNSATVVLLQDT